MCEKTVLGQIRDLAWAVYPEPEAGVRVHIATSPLPVSRRAKARVRALIAPWLGKMCSRAAVPWQGLNLHPLLEVVREVYSVFSA